MPKKYLVVMLASMVVLTLAAFSNTSHAQDTRDSVFLWYGNVDSSPLYTSIDDTLRFGISFACSSDVWVADCHFCIGALDQYIDSMLFQTHAVYFYPFTAWQVAEFTPVYHEAPEMPEGVSSQSFIGFATYNEPAPWLHFTFPHLVLTCAVTTADDVANIGDEVYAINDQGRNPFQGPSNAGDTNGGAGYQVFEYYSEVYFLGGGHVEGHITNFSGDPIEDATITDSETDKAAYSDDEGFYRIGLYPGVHDLTYSHPFAAEDTTVAGITIVENEDQTIDIIFHQLGSISGTVNDNDAQPVEGIVVQLINETYDTTDANGCYEFLGLQPDSYDIAFSHSDYRDTTITGVSVLYDQTTTADVVIHMLGAISGLIKDTHNQNINGAIVTFDGSVDTTGTNGAYSFDRIDAGTYNMTVTHDGFVDTTVAGIVINLDDAVELTVEMRRYGGIAGIAFDNITSIPIQGVIVVLNTGAVDTTDGAGFYGFNPLDNGTYEVTLSHDDYDDTTISDIEVVYDTITHVTVGMDPHLGIGDDKASIPEEYSLNQNYPNPFNANTNIKYGLPEDAYVTIAIYDLLGRHVETLVNTHLQAGYHQVTWNANKVTSGAYFYTINANDFSQKKTLMLVK
ncbi:MAG: carboxypeptidase regulatory-like domain-containing protein [candidate division Zixibacteria bacterium]|nr:carboxypeptidase regulatory-like domain-containing protein [candidate division Zixibacteria bacterium]